MSSTFISIITLICSVVTAISAVVAAIVAYKASKSIASNHVKTKQVEQVSNLVEYLNKTKIPVSLWDDYDNEGTLRPAEYTNIAYNLFEIANLEENPKPLVLDVHSYSKSYNDIEVFVSNQKVLDINSFVDNPFTPCSIADKLKPFYFESGEENSTTKHNKNTIVVLGDFTNIPNNYSFKTWKKFITYTRELKSEIEDWFKKNNIECNLRTKDFKNHHNN